MADIHCKDENKGDYENCSATINTCALCGNYYCSFHMTDHQKRCGKKISNKKNKKNDNEKLTKDQNTIVENSKNKIFIVHGHDDGLKNEIARYVEKIGLEAIILHEQPNQGSTIIEKFEKNTNEIDLAIVLLSPDDLGREKTEEKLNKRARQNVIFELGYFFGKLGRNKVVVIRKENVERPSDYNGIIYINYDQGWKMNLLRELKSLGISYDQSKII